MKSKTTRRALVMSLLSLLLCMSMLVGTTFAWFTDSVTSGRNQIVAGNLDIQMNYLGEDNNGDPTWLPVDPTTKLFNDNALWEPGHTEIAYLQITNAGSLALKYQLAVKVYEEIGGTNVYEKPFALSDYLVFDVVDIDGKTAGSYDRDAARAEVGSVKGLEEYNSGTKTLATANDPDPNAVNTAYVMLVIYMPEDVGNEANYLTGTTAPSISMGVELNATQYTYEEDSYGSDYDEDAYLPVVYTVEELLNAIADGESVRLGANMNLDGRTLVIPANYEGVLDLNGNTIVGNTHKDNGPVLKNEGYLEVIGGTITSTANNGGSAIVNNGTMTVTDAVLNGAPNADDGWPSYAVNNTGTLEINDSLITSYHGGVSSYTVGAMVTLNDSEIDMTGIPGFTSHGIYTFDSGFVLVNGGTYVNSADDQSSSGGSVINGNVQVFGGTFSGRIENYYGTPVLKGGTFDANPTSWVAAGHAATQNADGTWTVDRVYTTVSAGGNEAANGAALAAAINASTDTAFIQLAPGTYKMPDINGSKAFTIVGTEDCVIDLTKGAYLENCDVAFEGVTIKGSTGMSGSNYAALYTPNVTYLDCTFSGPFRIGRDGAVFSGCTFNDLGNDYVWNYGNSAGFFNCTFNTEGKALLLYSDGGSGTPLVMVEGCTFNATQGGKAGAIANQNCAAIEIDNRGKGVELICEDNTYAEHFSGEWRIKTYETGKSAVIVNGVTYTTIALDGKKMTIDGNKNVTVD